MKFSVTAVLCGLFLAGTLAAKPSAEPSLPFTIRDLVRLERVSDLAASPDGKRVLYTQRRTDLEANKGRTSLYVLDTSKRNALPQRLTESADNAGSGEWSADGRYVYFLSNRSGTSQVWRTTPGGGDTTQVTHLPLDVGSFRVSPQSDRIAVSMEVFTDCADLPCTKQRLDTTAKAPGSGVLYQELFVRHWDTWSDGRRSQLFVLKLAGGEAGDTPLNVSGGIGDVPSKPFGGREDYGWSPDGKSLVFSVRSGKGEPWSTNFDVYLADASNGGTPKNLTGDNPAWDAQPAYSPDGRQIAYLAMERPGFEADRFHLVLMNVSTGDKRPLTQNWDRSVAGFAWARDGKSLFATTDHLGQKPLWSIDVASGRASAITGPGDVEGFTVGSNKIFYALSSLTGPADVYAVGFGGGRPTQLTKVNQTALEKRAFGEATQFSFPGWNNENVFGYVVKPADFKKDRRYPVAFLVHGGPQGSFGNAWSYRWNPQVFAGAGYAVVMIDFHGSTGYGQAFTDSISGDWGGKPLEDLKAGLSAALKQNAWLDGDRVCALGASYGGYMMNWILGAWPDRFKCIVSHDGIFDQRAMYYATEELWFNEHEFGGPEFQNPAGYTKQNPVDLVSKWKTPTLVIHGQQDFRVPDTQGLSVFTALQRQNVPSELLIFPNENHWVLKPNDSIQWYDTVLGWLNRWTSP